MLVRTTALVSATATLWLAPGAASAGTLTLNIDALNNGLGCGNLSTNGDSFFTYAPPCSGTTLGMEGGGGPAFFAGARFGYQVDAPPGIAIYQVVTNPNQIYNINLAGSGWGGGSYYAGGGQEWHQSDAIEIDGPLDTPYWGFQIVCGASPCYSFGDIYLNSIQITAVENQGPSLTAVGSNNLWYQGGRWLWNGPGNPWPITLASGDPSGVCSMGATVNGISVSGPSATPLTDRWQQCPDQTWTPGEGASVDTRTYVPGTGPLDLALGATNAAGVPSLVTETLSVDNVPVSVALTTPTDPTPSQWVSHPVTVNAAASAGPSHVAGTSCGVDRGAYRAYPAGGVTVDGDGVHTVSCTAWNNAIDPNGNHNSGTSSVAIHIDEAPPTIGFEPQNPADPTGLVVDTRDNESGVAGGQIQMCSAAGANCTPLATQFDGQHLLAHFDDSGRSGPYEFVATSCDSVGNCGSTSETLALPVRLGTVAAVGFGRIKNPLRAQVVHKRVLVGWHWASLSRASDPRRVKRGGHWKRITVIRWKERCNHKRVRVGRQRWRERTVCHPPRLVIKAHKTIAYGRSFRVDGLVMTGQGVPLPGQRVQIMVAPANGSRTFTRVAGATTDATGVWSAKLPPGPSEIIRARSDGTAMILPAAAKATTTVPARVDLIKVTPKDVAWGGTVRIVGRLEGGYLPAGGALLRLRIGSGSSYTTFGIQEHVGGRGRFSAPYTFGAGLSSVYQSFWLEVSSLPMGNYPYAPANSRKLTVVVGGHPTAPAAVAHRKHHRHHARHKHKLRGTHRS